MTRNRVPGVPTWRMKGRALERKLAAIDAENAALRAELDALRAVAERSDAKETPDTTSSAPAGALGEAER